MKTLSLNIIGLGGLFSLLVSSAFAISSTPVGYVTHTINANSDIRLGINLDQSTAFSGQVTSVTGGAIDAGSSVGDLTTNAHFVRITSGTLEGNWYEITSASGNVISVAEDLASAGLAPSDTLSAIPFWTYDSLLPSGGGLPTSSNIFGLSEIAVYTYDPSASGINNASSGAYAYDSVGMLGFTGWVNLATFGSGGSDRINPDTFIQIRNNTASPVNFVHTGTVPTSDISFEIVSSTAAQDNLVYNPFPTDVSFDNSNLIESGAVNASPNIFDAVNSDVVYVFAMDSSGLNPAAAAGYVYDSVGMLGFTGWVNLATFGPAGTDLIKQGQAIMIRKAAGSASSATWSATMPYNLTAN
jgi:uncharacterized protein (TIGR02597 family)